MDLLLGGFALAHVPGFDEAKCAQFEVLLLQSDPDLYNWYTEAEPLPANLQSDVMALFLRWKLVD